MSQQLISYDITWDAIEAYPQLKIVTEKYQNEPTLEVYLATSLAMSEGMGAAKSFITKNYHQFPDYFFARYMYAQLCIDEKNFKQTANALKNKFDLKLLYPHRSVFHISEVLAFSYICGQYFIGIDNIDQAKIYMDMIRELDSNHKFLKVLERLLETKTLFSLLGKQSKQTMKRFFSSK